MRHPPAKIVTAAVACAHLRGHQARNLVRRSLRSNARVEFGTLPGVRQLRRQPPFVESLYRARRRLPLPSDVRR